MTAPYRTPPDGWLDFGRHAGGECPSADRLELSTETGRDGLPLWERHGGCTIVAADAFQAEMADGYDADQDL